MKNWYYPDTSSTAGKGFYLWHTGGDMGGQLAGAEISIELPAITFKAEGLSSLSARHCTAMYQIWSSNLIKHSPTTLI